jgi:hypothetical protein
MNETIQVHNPTTLTARLRRNPPLSAQWRRLLPVLVLAGVASVAQAQYGGPSGATPSSASGSGGNAASFHVDDKYAGLSIDPKYPVDPGTLNHTINDFRPESRDIFHLMDQTADAQGNLKPLDFNAPQPEDQNNPAQQAIYGRNTWLMWCGGDEYFWDWLSQDAYGVLDFLRMLDSRKRESRFRDLGLINQPGLRATAKPGPYGLYLDVVERRIGEGEGYSPYSGPKPKGPDDPNALEGDGVNPAVYGYPSGVIGLRLFPNPNFTTNKAAQKWWNAEAFYKDPDYARNPRTVRPFLVGMSCALCHVAAHPLNPPADPEEPEWSNLSSIIGNQYFRTSAAFGSSVDRANFLWFYLASQQPGTIDTSMVTSDHINNANAMNAIFELPARLARAQLNPAETQDEEARTLPGDGDKDRLVPRVLMDGADSIGVFGALARVYLNIGMYHDEWNLCANPVIGFVPQKPFSIEACRHNSVYWRVNENFRVAYLAQFLSWDRRQTNAGQCSTVAMKLKDARVPLERLTIQAIAKGEDQELPTNGTSLFVVKEEGNQIQIRIFAANGDLVVDKEATELALDAGLDAAKVKTNQLQILRGLFNGGMIHGELAGDLKRAVAESVMELADYTPKFVDLPENQHHWNESLALQGSQVFTRNCMICHSSKQPGGFTIHFEHNPPAPPQGTNSRCQWTGKTGSPSNVAPLTGVMSALR